VRIRFLTSSIEPGKDGIGDYTLRLAAQCEKRGHDVEIVAFNDKHLAQTESGEKRLRLPRAMGMSERLRSFENWSAGRAEPDWASVQFVPYGFHDKGLVGGWREPMKRLAIGAKRQVMAHETWIGQEKSAPWRHRLMGAMQKPQALRMFKELGPKMVHTSNEFYAGLLAREGWPAKVLPLAGNIPISAKFSEQERKSFEQKIGVADRPSICVVGIFGAIYPEWNPARIIPNLREAAAEHGKRLVIVAFGRIGPGAAVWEKMKRDFGAQVFFGAMGELRPAEISGVLQELDAGLCVSPFELLGKSSAVATILEHGLPVIVSRFENSGEPAQPPPGIVTPSTLARLFAANARPAPRDPGATAEQFLADLRDAA
jgi:hypothetical protein